jgi:rhodanese-related sulfurtransferase
MFLQEFRKSNGFQLILRLLPVAALLLAITGCDNAARSATPDAAAGAVIQATEAEQITTIQQAAPAPTEAGWQEISIEEAAARREAGAFMLDVRSPEEWNELHIPGATLIPLDELETRVSEIPKNQEVIVYCRSGNRSKTGAEILAKDGYTPVSSMAGGIKQWQAAGYPTETGP